MKKSIPIKLLVFAAAPLLSQLCLAQIPQQLNYQGRVSVNGVNYNGPGQFKFALVDAGTTFGSTATATAVVDGGVVTAVNVDLSGTNYLEPPTITFGGPGSGAQATATLNLGIVTSIMVTEGGSGYTEPPIVTISPPSTSVYYYTHWSNDATSTVGDEPLAAVEIPVVNGLYSVQLGGSTPVMSSFDQSIFSHKLHLRVWFSDGANGFRQLTPDQPLSSAPYALMAHRVPDGSIERAKLSPSLLDYLVEFPFTRSGNTESVLFSLTNSGSGNVIFGESLGTGIGVKGESASGYGVAGRSHAPDKAGVWGYTETAGEGIFGQAVGAGIAVKGVSSGSHAVFGQSEADGHGVYGYATGGGLGVLGYATGGNIGVKGESTQDYGVAGRSFAPDKAGVWGYTETPGEGVFGQAVGEGIAVKGASSGSHAVFGQSEADGHGVYGYATGGGLGVLGYATGGNIGVKGESTLDYGVAGRSYAAGKAGVWGYTETAGEGIFGQAVGAGVAVKGASSGGHAVHGLAEGDGYGGFFEHTNGGIALGCNGPAEIGGNLYIRAADLSIGAADRRGSPGRAVVDWRAAPGATTQLYLNFGDDWQETVIGGSVTIVKSLRITGGADLAEPFAMSHENVEPGSVVIIDEKNPGKLRVSHAAYDKKVAGIVSGADGIKPGISMIQEDMLEAGENVALSGRVYVRANNSAGDISPGDLLTTSAIPGEAMKASDHDRAQGAILGKAMTGLSDESGKVLVLVTLQ